MLARRTVPSPIVTGTFCCSTTPYWAGSGDQASAVPLNSATDDTTVSATPRPSFETPCLRIRTPVCDRQDLAAERPTYPCQGTGTKSYHTETLHVKFGT